MNIVVIAGNLGGDPELRYTGDQTPVCSFSLATNESKGVVAWHKVVVWGKPAETAAKHLNKGSKVGVTGRIVYRKFTDKQGIERNVTEIHTNAHVEFMSQKKEQGGGRETHGGDEAALDSVPF